jgi:hypothetical protein
MAKQPKTIEDWRKERLRKARRENGYILIPMELWNGEAFQSLSKAERLIVIECLAQVRYAPKSSKKREKLGKDSLFKCSLGYLLNQGEFGLPTKYLQERGIKGEDTIARAKKRLVEIGFIDVVQTGSFMKAGRFRYSDRWRAYNPKTLCSYQGPMPGYCHYPNIRRHNDTIRNSKSDCQDEYPAQLDLFDDYARPARRS